jgi:hypothetical protein
MSTFIDKLAAQWEDRGNLVLGLWLPFRRGLFPTRMKLPRHGTRIASELSSPLPLYRRWRRSRNGKSGSTPRSAGGYHLALHSGVQRPRRSPLEPADRGALVGGLALWAALTGTDAASIET